jgi:ribulose 1,5-bisphosphate synthetase/thiazole synthase
LNVLDFYLQLKEPDNIFHYFYQKFNSVENTHFDIIIVGGGIVGLASAYKINIKYPNKKNTCFRERGASCCPPNRT